MNSSLRFLRGWRLPCLTLAAGGGTSTGGVFSVSATIGQHDAGTMAGGEFSLVGGFWAAILQTPGAPILTLTPAGPGLATLSWSPDLPGFYLQMSDLLTPSAWTNAPSGTNQPITISTTGPARFFRLIQP